MYCHGTGIIVLTFGVPSNEFPYNSLIIVLNRSKDATHLLASGSDDRNISVHDLKLLKV